jgi:hypothetical protein
MRVRGHEGEKCWYPATHEKAHDHGNGIAPNDEATETRPPQSTPAARARSTLPASLALLSNATEIATSISEESSFADRFAAVDEDSRGLSPIIRSMIDPIGSRL